MDIFALIVFGGLAAVLLCFWALGSSRDDHFVSEVLDRRRNERWAVQLQIEEGELAQMLEAANVYRQERGESPVTLGEFRKRAAADQRRLIRQARRHQRDRALDRR